jgi:hypothetical protein
MEVIDFGYKLPELGDQNFWDSYNFDVVRLSTHDHDGVNSKKLAGNSHAPVETIIGTAPATWTLDAGSGKYYFNIAFPAAWLMTFPNPGIAQTMVEIFDSAATKVFMEWKANPTNDGIWILSQVVPTESIYVAMY